MLTQQYKTCTLYSYNSSSADGEDVRCGLRSFAVDYYIHGRLVGSRMLSLQYSLIQELKMAKSNSSCVSIAWKCASFVKLYLHYNLSEAIEFIQTSALSTDYYTECVYVDLSSCIQSCAFSDLLIHNLLIQ